jgi:hypothetical protein
MKRRALPALLIVLLLSAVVVPAGDARDLNLTYATTLMRACTTSNNIPFGIDGSGLPTVIPPGASRQSAVDTALVTFQPDGTGTLVGTTHTMNLTATSGPIFSISEFSRPFTYSASESDGTVDLEIGEGTFRTLAGAGAGNTGTVSARASRYLLSNGVLAYVDTALTTLEQETLNLNLAAGGTLAQYRICTRSQTGVRR